MLLKNGKDCLNMGKRQLVIRLKKEKGHILAINRVTEEIA